MARDRRVTARTPRERSEGAAAECRELLAGDSLSAGERAIAYAGLAQAEATLVQADAAATLVQLLAERLPSASETIQRHDFKELLHLLTATSTRFADGR